MKTKFKYTLLLFLFSVILFEGCKPRVAESYNYEAECLGSNFDGTQRVRIASANRDKQKAIDNGLKKILNTVLFKGIRNGQEGCKVDPMLNEVNASKRYEAYFEKFFADKGTYTDFIELSPKKDVTKKSLNYQGGNGIAELYIIVCNVKVSELRKQLIKDNILKSTENN